MSSGVSTPTAQGALAYRSELGAADIAELGIRIPPGTSMEAWKTIGRRIASGIKVLPWKAGDWANHGEEHFGYAVVQEVAGDAGFDLDELRDFALAAGRFQIQRRRPKLSIQHHVQLALWGSDVDQDQFLQRAEAEGWSQRDMKAAIREAALSEAESFKQDAQAANSSDKAGSVSESAELMALQESMKTMITFDVVRAVKAHAMLEDVPPLDQWRWQLQRIQESAPEIAE